MRQGNDVGTQYRSAIFTSSDAQLEAARAARDAYARVLAQHGYGAIMTEATYSPWNKDDEFQATFEAIKSHTLVDSYRCYELWSLVDMVADCQGDLLEIGVWRGGTGSLIARRAQLSGINATGYLCDTFSGGVKATDKDPVYVGGEHADASVKHVTALLQDLGLTNARVLPGVFPEETGQALKDCQFRFCHIDVDVYQSAKEIVDWLWDRLVVGGIIVYDDYGTEATAGITRFVDEQRKMSDRRTIYNLNGHAVTVKIR
jgi:O-methyltransferase